MKNTFILGIRVLRQLLRDKWFLFFSLAAPIAIIAVMKVFFDTFPDHFPVEDYIVAISATVVHVITFVLAMISVVEERARGTLSRMFVNGVSKVQIIVGYILGYLVLASVQALIVVSMTFGLFSLDYSAGVVVWLFVVIWALALASVVLGVFVSSFAKRELHIIPFIPLIILPSVFLSGIIVDFEELPVGPQIIGKLIPLHYADSFITEITAEGGAISDAWVDISLLVLIIVALVILASTTLKTVE